MNSWTYQPIASKKQTRTTFFSFHYEPDNQRAQVVKQSWLTKPDREAAGFFDSSAFETEKRPDDVLQQFLTEQLKGTSVTCVLVGTETAIRPWVRYELIRSFHRGNGLLAVRVHSIRDWNKQPCGGGFNPFDQLAYRVANGRVYWQAFKNGAWANYDKVPSIQLNEVAYDLTGQHHHTFSYRFPIYDWVNDNGYQNLGDRIERAAQHAGK